VIGSLILLVPFAIVVLWGYFHFSPKHAPKKSVRAYDATAVALATVCCPLFVWTVYVRMSTGVDAPWWPVLATLGCLVVFPICLLVAGLMRYVVFLRKRDRDT
jgi:hypothetical protein